MGEGSSHSMDIVLQGTEERNDTLCLRPSPVTFASHNPPDVLISLFGREIHVHSDILRLYAHYFREMFDNFDPRNKTSELAKFKYRLVPKSWVHEDLAIHWKLVLATSEEDEGDYPRSRALIPVQLFAICKLFDSLYDNPYHLEELYEFVTMVEMAKLYGCLPRLSRSLTAALLREKSTQFRLGMSDCWKQLAWAALELRHGDLLSDALNYMATSRNLKFGAPLLTGKFSKTIHAMCRSALRQVEQLIGRAHISLLEDMADSQLGENTESVTQLFDLMKTLGTDTFDGSFPLPEFYRIIHDSLPRRIEHGSMDKRPMQGLSRFRASLDNLLVNNLNFRKEVIAGEEPYQNNFLCVWIRESEYPWDTEQITW